MTPQEKAKELYEAYLPLVQRWDDFKAVSIKKENAKQCASMTCDEVLGYMGADRGYEFWSQVKEEIEKL